MTALLLSMTGFGEAHRQQGPLSVSVEVRTVNNKHFKLSIRTSEGYSSLEPQIEALVRRFVKRGTVQMQIRIDRRHAADDYQINCEVLEGYRQQLETLSSQWHLPETISLDSLLQLPGVIEERATASIDTAEDWPVIEKTLTEAIEGLAQMRRDEGVALEADLKTNCQSLATQVDQIEARLPHAVDDYRRRLTDRVNKVLEQHDVSLQPADIVREISLFTERSDVSEEIVRLRSHLVQVAATLALPESAGRKLDFLTQEMFREANTIGSKASDVEMSACVINAKAAIERMREQSQNVE